MSHADPSAHSVDHSRSSGARSGVFTPGVKLFRQLGFAAKAGIISFAFLIPLAVLGWSFFSSNAASIAFSAAERDGVVYLRALLPSVNEAQTHRNRALRGDSGQAAGAGALAEVQARLGKSLSTDSQWKAVEQSRTAVGAIAANADAEQRFATHNAHISALLDLLSQAADGSNLTLDPDVDTYYMMDAVTTKSPALIESLAQLADTAAAVGVAGEASDIARRRIDRLATVSDAQLSALKSAINKVLTQRSDLASVLSVDAAATAVRQVIDASQGAVKSDGLVNEGKRIADQARTAVGLLQVAQKAQLDTLDVGLAARISGLESQRNRVAAVVVVTISLAAYLFMAFYLATRGGLAAVRSHIDAIAHGDLTRMPRAMGRDETAHLMESLSATQTALRRIVSQVRTGADVMVHASKEIASGAQDLSGRTVETAASIEQSAAAMEQISATVRGTTENAQRGAEIATGNADVARRGGAVIDDVVRTMEEIQQASAKVSSIIAVIDGIAFQTNILALNAAVEAARAGEQGRGFAVVASEVRALSQRSAEAAREIKSLIDTTVQQIATGAGVVRDAGNTMRRLVGNAEELKSLSAAIADAANQQDTGVTQVGVAIQELDRSAQQNSALVEETATAASQLNAQAVALAETVAIFKLPAHTAH